MLTESVVIEKEKMFNHDLNENFNEKQLKENHYLYLTKIKINDFHQAYLNCLKELIKDDGITDEFLDEFLKQHNFLVYLKENINVKNNNEYEYIKANLYLETKVLENALKEKDLTILHHTVKRLKKYFKNRNFI